MVHRKFGHGVADDDPEVIEPITFDLGEEEGICCRMKVNGKLLIELVGKVDSPSVSRQSEGIIQVFDVVVLTNDGDNPEDWTGKRVENHSTADLQMAAEDQIRPGIDPTSSHGRLLHVLDDPDTEITLKELAELVGWLVEQYTGRPTRNAESSRNGAGGMRATSRRARRSADRIIVKEAQIGSSTSSTASS